MHAANDRTINKKPRGYSTEFSGTSYGIEISNVLWKDNKSPRYDRKSKRQIKVDCPQIIREYNSHMGGVDLMDSLMGRMGRTWY